MSIGQRRIEWINQPPGCSRGVFAADSLYVRTDLQGRGVLTQRDELRTFVGGWVGSMERQPQLPIQRTKYHAVAAIPGIQRRGELLPRAG